MVQEKVLNMNEKQYLLITDYKDNAYYRNSLNRLTKKTYGFDFEQWYQSGYWQGQYIPYSILYENEVVANVSVNTMEFLIHGSRVCPIQLGTVMTEESHRNQGLIRSLMNSILPKYEKSHDFIYLFANSSVLDFYPKFGFMKVQDYCCTKTYDRNQPTYGCRKLHMDDEKDKNLLLDLISKVHPNSKVTMLNNKELIMFYCDSFMKENIYYIEALNTAVIAEYNGNQLIIKDVFCEKPVELDPIINTLMNTDTMNILLGFSPIDDISYTKSKLIEADTTLFIRGKNPLMEDMFPVLSHA